MSFRFLLVSVLLASISAQTSLFEGSSKSSLPYYSSVPLTDFRCENQQFAGYYADPEADCQVFHICIRRHERLEQFSFLCPNETVFHQQLLVCVWWDGFDCTSAPSLYYINENIFEDHGANIDLKAHVPISQGKSLITDNKAIPSSPAIDSASIGKALLPLVKPSPQGRSFDIDNNLESNVSDDSLIQITNKPEIKELKQSIKPSKPTYLPQKSSRTKLLNRQNQKPLKQEVITNPDLQLLSEPHIGNFISTPSSIINTKKFSQTSTRLPVRTTEKPKDSFISKSPLPQIFGTNLPNDSKKSEAGVKLTQSANIPPSSLKKDGRKTITGAVSRKSITGNNNSKTVSVQTKANVSLKQRGKEAKVIQSPFSTVRFPSSPKLNLKESSLRQDKITLTTPKTLYENSVPVKISEKAVQKTTTPKLIKNPFTRVHPIVSTRPTSRSSIRPNNAAFSTPNSFRDNNILPKLKSSRIKSKTPTLPPTTEAPLSTSRYISTTIPPKINTNKQSQRKSIKSTVQRNQQRPSLKSKPKSKPNRNLSKGLTTYDILHDLLKNVTILRSKNLLKSNSDSGRRSVRQNNIQKSVSKPSFSKSSPSDAEIDKPRIKSYASGSKDHKSSYNYFSGTSPRRLIYGQKLGSNPTKVSNIIDTPQSTSPATTKVNSSASSFVPTLPPTEDTRKKTTQKKGYLNVSSKNKNIQVKNFQDFLNLDLPVKTSLPSSRPSPASSFPSFLSSSNYEDTFSLINSNIYETSSTPKNGLYK